MSVFDCSALLAMTFAEEGETAARARLAGGSISLVNVGETIGKLVRKGMSPDLATQTVKDFGLDWLAPDDAQAIRVGQLGAINDLSLADRFCIALAEARDEPLVTADQDWRPLDLSVPIDFIRSRPV